MSKLKNLILEQDDLTRVMYQSETWIDPDTGEGVMLELRSPSVRRRQEIMKQYQVKNPATGEFEIDLVDLQMALVLEMVFDPHPDFGQEDEPLFSEADRDALAEKSGNAVWDLSQECMVVAGFLERETDGESVGAERALVDEGKG
jgi:hypothetical protein